MGKMIYTLSIKFSEAIYHMQIDGQLAYDDVCSAVALQGIWLLLMTACDLQWSPSGVLPGGVF